MLKEEQLKLPVRIWGGPGRGQLLWKEPSYGIVMRLLRNPAYAGVYVYGEWAYDGTERNPKTGKSRPHYRAPEDWPVCIQGHHAGYLSWEEYLANRRRLRQNWFRPMTRGAPREAMAFA